MHGSSAAIVLSVLRDQGSSATVPVLVTYAAIGRLCGLHKRAVRRAIDRLVRDKVATAERYRIAGRLVVRTMDDPQGGHVPDRYQRDQPMRLRRDSIARLDTLRSLLEAVG